jgi:DNA mismatch endonuclease (patch repair protein)
MADPLSPADRSALMGRIRGKNTKPELLVRRLLHSMGYRFRTHYKPIPGRPDIAFTARRKAILVHGCFWHGHQSCSKAHNPKTRSEFWQAKFARNRERDRQQANALVDLGWEALTVWECEVEAEPETELAERLVRFLGPPRTGPAVTGGSVEAG